MRPMSAGLTVAILMSLALATPAWADWDWTRWTMSDDQVIAASGGRVKAARGGKDQQIDSWDLRAEGQIQQDGLNFRAQFYFDARGKALHVVRLTLLDFGDCLKLAKLMVARHGPSPTDYSNNMDLDDGPYTVINWEWPDDGHGDVISLTQAPPHGNFEGLCIMAYWRPGDTYSP